MTPAAYLLPSAMSLSRRAATRGSTTPMRMPLLIAIRRLPSGISSTASPGLTWASWRGVGQVGQEREAGLAGLLDEDRRPGALLPSWAGTVFSPAATSSILSRSMLRSAMRLVGSRARAVW